MSIKYISDFRRTILMPKKFSHSFLGSKIRFVSIMVTTLFFGVLHFMFKIDGAQRAKWTFLDVQKNVQK